MNRTRKPLWKTALAKADFRGERPEQQPEFLSSVQYQWCVKRPEVASNRGLSESKTLSLPKSVDNLKDIKHVGNRWHHRVDHFHDPASPLIQPRLIATASSRPPHRDRLIANMARSVAFGAKAMTLRQAGTMDLRVGYEDRKILQMQHHLNHASETREVMLRVAESLDAGGVEVIELDLGAMRMITSQTLNELITLNTRAKSCGVRLVLTNLADNLRDIFVITRLERMFELA